MTILRLELLSTLIAVRVCNKTTIMAEFSMLPLEIRRRKFHFFICPVNTLKGFHLKSKKIMNYDGKDEEELNWPQREIEVIKDNGNEEGDKLIAKVTASLSKK
ncbi:hypothetical protein WUBG_15626 [Wuchereria bancrofti]|uniref:Uncharacterized protein n=1 Tax=Wuchereria bancrofti TaxID=6293 RepID=J9E906_WUCBA|nr:hypothetical protein WUBG_15626 [Wuchereria bancrofti]